MNPTLHAPVPKRRRRRVVRLLAVLTVAVLSAAAAGAAAAADTHGYPRTFHIWGGWYGAGALSNYDMVVGYESNWDVAAMRRLNPNGVFLLSPGLNPHQVDTYDMVHLTYGAIDKWRGGTCPAPIGYVPPFDPAVDYLRHPDGSRVLVGGAWAHPGYDLARPATAVKVAKIFACAALRDGLVTNGWDGVWSDNWIHSIGASWFYPNPLDTDYDGVADAPLDLRHRWDDGLALAGKTLRQLLPGKTVGGNGIWYDSAHEQGSDRTSWLGEANVTMMEYQSDFYRKPQQFIDTVTRWLDFPDPTGLTRYFAVEQPALNADGSKFAYSGDVNSSANMLNAGVMKGMRWGLTLALMTGAYFEVNPDQMHDARWWYDEYDGGVGIRQRGYLGDALAAPQQLSTGVYRRDFANGIALNNSSDSPVVVQLESPYKHLVGTQNPRLNDGSVVTSVSIPAHDGVILLRTVPAPTGGGSGGDATDGGSTTGSGDSAGGTSTPVATVTGAHVPRRGRLSVKVRGARGAHVRVVVSSLRGHVLARRLRTVGASGVTRCRLRLHPYHGQRRLHLRLRARRAGVTTTVLLNIRLGRHGHRIIRVTRA